MVSQQDRLYILQLSQLSNQITAYYSYCIPWMNIGCDLFTLGVLFFRKRTEKNLHILIFKWQYFIDLIYALNMIFNDDVFSQSLFKYVLSQNSSDFVCKLHFVLMKYFYCMAPWMQVILTFDRLWSVVFQNRWTTKRTTKTVTLLILVVQGLVFLANLFNITYYASVSVSIQSKFDPVLNESISINTTQLRCVVFNPVIQTIQDMLFATTRIILPLVLMIMFSIYLFIHVRNSRRRVLHGRNQKRENYFTVAVASTNIAFLVFNSPITVYYMILYYLKYSNVSLSLLGTFQFNLFFIVAYLFSYMFTMCHFWLDLAFNRLFRKEIFDFCRLIFSRRLNRVVSETQNRSANTAN